MKMSETLNCNKDFKRLYAKGKYASSPLLVTYVLKNKSSHLRLGITTSKKIGNAVQRNRARRLIRVAYRSLIENLAVGFDIVFVARKGIHIKKSYHVLRDMSYQLKKLGILK